jgi:uncharacterized Zn finger protein (UPF0148 family)
MKIRGDRECKACGTRWSYYDTGSVTCPQCGSLKSVGVDDRKEHTASATEFDLTPVRRQSDDLPLRELADEAASHTREYVREAGFIDAGTLSPLGDTYLAARELLAASQVLSRSMQITDDEEYYLLTLLRGADQGERPHRDDVPESLRAARGLAYATAVGEYCQEVRTYLDDNPDGEARRHVTTLGEHRKRIDALDGDVSLSTSEALVRATRAIGRYIIEGDETALAEASQHFARLDPDT